MSAHAVSFAPSSSPLLSKLFEPDHDPTFAFAKLDGDICLVQLLGQTTADPSGAALLDVDVFRHEFVSIFRYSHSLCLHPLELRVLEPLADHAVRYEPDTGTVFLAKDLMTRLKRILDASAMLHRTSRRPRQPKYVSD